MPNIKCIIQLHLNVMLFETSQAELDTYVLYTCCTYTLIGVAVAYFQGFTST